MARSAPSAARGARITARRPRRQAVLSKRGNSAKIHPGLGFIWGIPVNMDELAEIGRIAAAKQVKPEHLAATFDVK
jgi:hypothetical protein